MWRRWDLPASVEYAGKTFEGLDEDGPMGYTCYYPMGYTCYYPDENDPIIRRSYARRLDFVLFLSNISGFPLK